MIRLHRRNTQIALALACVALCAGCLNTANRGVTLRKSPYNPLTEQLKLAAHGGPEPTDRTQQILRRYDLKRELSGEWQPVITKLQEYNVQDVSPEVQYSIAELSYIAGKKAELVAPDRAVDMYGTAVAHAYLYLFDSRLNFARNPYDPQFRGACDLYNQSLEGALRILAKRGLLKPGATYNCTAGGGHTVEVTVKIRAKTWEVEDFDQFEFASDYEVKGLSNQYRTYGLGVPLIAVRKKKESQSPTERYYPPDLSFPVTAFLRLRSDRHNNGILQASLELYDPLDSTDTRVKGRAVPLENDLSTPLAYFLNNPAFQDNDLATKGLFKPGESSVKGLYMLEPYQPGKIPVVMVHGLWSSPLTWMQMFNDLRALPEVRENYQFWFYLYPTGQPFWISAAQFRQDLAQMRQNLDPAGEQPSLSNMVLVGHSMGGLVSKLQTLTSGDDYWQIVSNKPFREVKGPQEAKEAIQQVVYFEANRSVQRVITIGTPHRGSNFASEPTRTLARYFIKLPEMLTGTTQQLRRENPDLFRDNTMIDISTSIDSLSPESPILPVILNTPTPPWTKYHNIVGVHEPTDWKSKIAKKIAGRGDGVVSYESAHLENVASEREVPADHMTIHTHPKTVMEVQRILEEHLKSLGRIP